jgi:hypothetical protein
VTLSPFLQAVERMKREEEEEKARALAKTEARRKQVGSGGWMTVAKLNAA